MKRSVHILLATAAVALGIAHGAAAQSESVFGVWRNPKNSVHVELVPCGEAACGYVVWANEKAQRDAREGGTDDLIGMQIFRDMQSAGDGRWTGKVFVPDLNRTVSGRAEAQGDGRLLARGCLIAGVLCKTQVWTRTDVATLP
jgi:uncharacterized protein (DUF2147 family)